MEVHSRVNSVLAKKVWNFLRIAYFMMRKGVISKRKLIMDMNLMMKRGKLLRKSLSNLMTTFHHHHHSRNATRGSGFSLQEYEFSCSNSPNPVFFHVASKRKQHNHHYFPCINPPSVDLSPVPIISTNELPKIQYSPEYYFNFRFGTPNREKLNSLLSSPFSVRVSNYSSEDENELVGNPQVDDDAEEFIRRFYEQLRMQSRTHLLEYQEELDR